MDAKNHWEVYVIGAVFIGGLAWLIISQSQSSSSGVSFSQANPTSVQALYTAQAADTATAATTAQTQIQANAAALGSLLGFEGTVSNNATTVATNGQNQNAATQIAGVQASSANYAVQQNTAATINSTNQAASVAKQQSTDSSTTALGVAGSAANASIASSMYSAQASEAASNDSLAATQDTNATAHSVAQTTSKTGVFNNILSTVGSLFSWI
jgi:hypothetical protein